MSTKTLRTETVMGPTYVHRAEKIECRTLNVPNELLVGAGKHLSDCCVWLTQSHCYAVSNHLTEYELIDIWQSFGLYVKGLMKAIDIADYNAPDVVTTTGLMLVTEKSRRRITNNRSSGVVDVFSRCLASSFNLQSMKSSTAFSPPDVHRAIRVADVFATLLTSYASTVPFKDVNYKDVNVKNLKELKTVDLMFPALNGYDPDMVDVVGEVEVKRFYERGSGGSKELGLEVSGDEGGGAKDGGGGGDGSPPIQS